MEKKQLEDDDEENTNRECVRITGTCTRPVLKQMRLIALLANHKNVTVLINKPVNVRCRPKHVCKITFI